MIKVQKNDFIELDFTGKVKDTEEIFDSTRIEDAKKMGLKEPEKVKPVIIAVGHLMTLKGLDEDLLEKEIEKDYSVEIKPESGFGKRNPSLVRMIPLKAFAEQQVYPQKGMQFSLDGNIVRIVSVSGGRVLVDFNNPLAGKDLVYNYRINKKIEDISEKINALQNFFFRKNFEFSLNEAEKTITFKVEKNISKYLELMSQSFKEILGFEVKTEILEPTEKTKKEN